MTKNIVVMLMMVFSFTEVLLTKSWKRWKITYLILLNTYLNKCHVMLASPSADVIL